MTELSYPWEKFMNAIFSLVGDGPLRGRVLSAYMSFHPLRAKDFDKFPELRVEFEELMGMLTRVEAKGGEGAVQATLNASSDEQVSKIAERIAGFFISIARERRQ